MAHLYVAARRRAGEEAGGWRFIIYRRRSFRALRGRAWWRPPHIARVKPCTMTAMSSRTITRARKASSTPRSWRPMMRRHGCTTARPLERGRGRREAQGRTARARDRDRLARRAHARRERGAYARLREAQFVSKGMIADFSVHEDDPNNPHAHVLLTMRSISEQGFGEKVRSWNAKHELLGWRDAWASHANEHLARAGHAVRIDHRTLGSARHRARARPEDRGGSRATGG